MGMDCGATAQATVGTRIRSRRFGMQAAGKLSGETIYENASRASNIPPVALRDEVAHAMNGKTPVYLTLLAAALFVTAVFIFQPYSVTSPWSVYTGPAQRYLQAALRRDSLALVQQSISPAPVEWGLRAGRMYPESLAVWAHEAEV